MLERNFNSIEEVNMYENIIPKLGESKFFQILSKVSPHPNIVRLIEALFNSKARQVALVFELTDRSLKEMIMNLKEYISETKLKIIMIQLLNGLSFIHKKGVLHRELSTFELINKSTVFEVKHIIKLGNFEKAIKRIDEQPFTAEVGNLWYRAPELMITKGFYDQKVDLWSAGCIMFELITKRPLFQGENEADQIFKISEILGSPDQELLKTYHVVGGNYFEFPFKEGIGMKKLLQSYRLHISDECIDLLNKLLVFNPDDRISAEQALYHPFFRDSHSKNMPIMISSYNSMTPAANLITNQNANQKISPKKKRPYTYFFPVHQLKKNEKEYHKMMISMNEEIAHKNNQLPPLQLNLSEIGNDQKETDRYEHSHSGLRKVDKMIGTETDKIKLPKLDILKELTKEEKTNRKLPPIRTRPKGMYRGSHNFEELSNLTVDGKLAQTSPREKSHRHGYHHTTAYSYVPNNYVAKELTYSYRIK